MPSRGTTSWWLSCTGRAGAGERLRVLKCDERRGGGQPCHPVTQRSPCREAAIGAGHEEYLGATGRSRPELDTLTPDNLLVPPVSGNQLGWTKGYFISVTNGPVLTVNGKEIASSNTASPGSTARSLTRAGRFSMGRTEPCVEWGLGNHRTLDDAVSDALGLPRAPDPA